MMTFGFVRSWTTAPPEYGADRITYVGLDVHKESIVVAAAAGGLRGWGG
jgi:hypothetical protein